MHDRKPKLTNRINDPVLRDLSKKLAGDIHDAISRTESLVDDVDAVGILASAAVSAAVGHMIMIMHVTAKHSTTSKKLTKEIIKKTLHAMVERLVDENLKGMEAKDNE